MNEKECQLIRQMGYSTTFVNVEKDAIINAPEDYDVVVCNWLFQYQKINRFVNLKAIQLLSAGMDRVPLDYIKTHKIQLENARGVYSVPMAEYAVMGVLDYLKKSRELYSNEENHLWVKNRSAEEISEKTVCILGMGSIGREVAKKFAAFTTEIIGVDITPMNIPFFTKTYGIKDLHEAIAQSDIVIVTLPLTSETRELINYSLFSAMKTQTILVNIARGALINMKDLERATYEHIVRYAILDVFDEEPLSDDNWCWENPNIRVTPHCSFISTENNKRLKKIVFDNLKRWSTEYKA